MKKTKLSDMLIPILSAVFLGVFCYAAYALYYEFDFYPDGHLWIFYLVMMAALFSAEVFIAVSGITKKKAVPTISFAVSAGAFCGIFLAVNSLLNADFTHNDEVITSAFSVLFPLAGTVWFLTFVLRAKNKHRILNSLLAIVYFAVACAGGFVVNKDRIKEEKFKQTITFDTVSADRMTVTDGEKARCREWFFENVLLTGENRIPVYDFNLGDEKFSDIVSRYDMKLKDYGTSYEVLFTAEKLPSVTVKAALYEEKATCEWTVYINNTTDADTKNISDFYAIDAGIKTGKADVYYSRGSVCESSDFALVKKSLSTKKVFSCSEGRSSLDFMPYFNIAGENFGAVLAIGWTGEWEAVMKNEKDSTRLSVKQKTLDAYLQKGEEIRSPLVSVSFYEDENPLKGFNTFRRFITSEVYPDNIPSTMTMMEVAGPMSVSTTDEIFAVMDTFGSEIFENVDHFWMDAGWYSYDEGWYDSVGTWKPDPLRYDNGIIEISDYGKAKGCGLTLWYEPERVYEGSELDKIGKANEGWLVTDGGEFGMWNMANDEACDYLCNLIASSLKENGVSVYRQDFNFDIKSFWEKADRELYGGRKGICENRYITNVYRYLDYLTENVDGLIIDNCASGGRRLDLEMTRRSVPVWRSDYNCAPHDDLLEATQAQTYNLSFWLPISGTIRYSESEYASRTGIIPCTVETFGTVHSEDFAKYTEQREMMVGNFYPIECGGYDGDKILAMQYSSYDARSGEALIYKRADVNENEYTLKLNGLYENTVYTVYDFDNPEKIYEMTGKSLMNDGLKLSLPEGEKAIIVMFSAK